MSTFVTLLYLLYFHVIIIVLFLNYDSECRTFTWQVFLHYGVTTITQVIDQDTSSTTDTQLRAKELKLISIYVKL